MSLKSWPSPPSGLSSRHLQVLTGHGAKEQRLQDRPLPESFPAQHDSAEAQGQPHPSTPTGQRATWLSRGLSAGRGKGEKAVTQLFYPVQRRAVGSGKLSERPHEGPRRDAVRAWPDWGRWGRSSAAGVPGADPGWAEPEERSRPALQQARPLAGPHNCLHSLLTVARAALQEPGGPAVQEAPFQTPQASRAQPSPGNLPLPHRWDTVRIRGW